MNFIRDSYGSYRNYLRHLWAQAANAAGHHRTFNNLDWTRIDRFVFVCKGNVCRSPYAQAKCRQLGVAAASFGLQTSGEVPANPAAIRVARSRGVDLTEHRSKQFNNDQLRTGDLIVGFETAHLAEIAQRLTNPRAQVTLLGLWSVPNQRAFVADPFGKSDQYFQTCFSIIDAATQSLCERVQLRTAPPQSRSDVSSQRQVCD